MEEDFHRWDVFRKAEPWMNIVQYPHPALRHRARPLTAIDKKVRLYAGEMLRLMYEARGLGLGAPQVALPVQMFVMNPTADPEQRDKEFVLINPVILERKGTIEGEEGCLSFPGLYQKIRRAKSVKVQAYDLEGKELLLEVAGSTPEEQLCSRLMQHEIDHLDGVLFIDKMGPIAKLASRGSLREFERDYRRAQQRGEIPPDAEIEKSLTEMERDGGESPPIL
jgi:peptide deformylase